jgi:hypothetical protein
LAAACRRTPGGAHFLETELDVLLRLTQLLLELLIAELELLDKTGELTDLVLEPVEPHHEIGRSLGLGLNLAGRCRRVVAPAEDLGEHDRTVHTRSHGGLRRPRQRRHAARARRPGAIGQNENENGEREKTGGRGHGHR